MIKIVNGTSHDIVFYKEDDCYAIDNGRKLIKKEQAEPFKIIKAGKNLNATKYNLSDPNMDCDIPLKGAIRFDSHDPLPDADLIIVSQLFKAACKEIGTDTNKLATIDGTVYENEEALRPCGCLALSVG